METHLIKFTYPSPFVLHPDIRHQNMTEKIFPYLKKEPLTFEKYMSYFQVTYLILCTNFDEYLEFLEQEFWKEFKNKKRIKIEYE